ncbi:VWA domain-containing protein [Microbacterium profundi]|uniref:vWA domain-containing protein n=1 Tax=Microbacterium profundi TaxID=450380 RepID=UPI0027DF2C9F|nr:VWA domain-containing protein [Microbacterium profundi]MCE7481476.1 VWA domain-containing protein [Microbacterium profundi]
MIFQPVLNIFLLVLLFAPVAFVVVWMLVKAVRPQAGSADAGTGAPPVIWGLRLLMLLACFMMLLRPGIPGGATETLATDTDILIVVDTTASIVAEDWDGDAQRLDGVRADVQSIVDEYPGARFALISFDAASELRLPLTTDATALISSLEVLRPEVTAQSRGSSIGIASAMVEETLQAAAESAPDRSRMVFYLGDGEQTVTTEPESFSASAEYTDGGAVLGYGTSEGGPMKVTSGSLSSDESGEYIEYQGERAMSVVDEANLQTIADDLGVEYQLRSADADIELPEAPTTTTNYTESGSVGNVIELYWIFALVMVLLLGVEIARATILIAQMRGLAQPRTRGSLSERSETKRTERAPASRSEQPAPPSGGDA